MLVSEHVGPAQGCSLGKVWTEELLFLIFVFMYLVALGLSCSIWDLFAWSGIKPWAPCIGSAEPYPLDHQWSPWRAIFILIGTITDILLYFTTLPSPHLLPIVMTYRSKGSTHSIWQPWKGQTLKPYSIINSTLFTVWMTCGDTRVSHFFTSQRQHPVLPKSTDPGTQIPEPNSLGLNPICTLYWSCDLEQLT